MSSAPFDPDANYGAILVGALVSAVLFGVSTVQAYIYWQRFPDDRPAVKALVAAVWTLEAAHMGMMSHTLYTWLVIDYGNPAALLGRAPDSLVGFILMTVFVSVLVQTFFSYRIYILSRSLTWAMVLYASNLLRCGLGLAIFSLTLLSPTQLAFSQRFPWLLITLWSLSAAGDLAVMLSLVWLLWRQRRMTDNRQSEFLLDKIIKWTIETGVATSMFTTVMLICYHTMPNTLVWMGLFVGEARMFANSLFASLNSRTALRAVPRAYEANTSSDGIANASGSRTVAGAETLAFQPWGTAISNLQTATGPVGTKTEFGEELELELAKIAV
ncbi:hypothetical protein HMN09_01103900 [Mycena chlorophos]|uniref:DUF6534 domain-containing protein n=1 Tax=Mycena chlorophos TaxID=658473 RepID=A0A8H6SBE8_MYCCL|nr:hypothetical protein HMN09_01103900 [Mycena chlorophos]